MSHVVLLDANKIDHTPAGSSNHQDSPSMRSSACSHYQLARTVFNLATCQSTLKRASIKVYTAFADQHNTCSQKQFICLCANIGFLQLQGELFVQLKLPLSRPPSVTKIFEKEIVDEESAEWQMSI